MEIQLALIMQLSNSTEGLHGQFGHIPISSRAIAVFSVLWFFLQKCNHKRYNWTHMLKPCLNHCIPWHIYTYVLFLEESYNELQAIPNHCIAAGYSTSNGEGYTRGYFLHAFLCYESIIKKWRTG